MRSMRNQTR